MTDSSATRLFSHALTQRMLLGSACVAILMATLMSAGCKSAYRKSMVQVTEEPSSIRESIPAPEQRLATLRTDHSPKPSVATQDKSAAPASARTVAAKKPTEGAANKTAKPDATPTSAPKKDSTTDDVIASDKAKEPSSPTKSGATQMSLSDSPAQSNPITTSVVAEAKQPPADSTELVAASLTDLSAPEDTSPSPADPSGDATAHVPVDTTTAVPNSLAAALRASLKELPELPPPSDEPTDQFPTRLAAVENPTPSSPVEPLRLASFDDISEDNQIDGADLQPTAGTRPTVQRVSHDADSTSGAPVHAAKLSDKELYEILVQRLLQTTDEMSDAEKRRRLIIAKHLTVLSGSPDKATESMDGLNEADQQYLVSQLHGLWAMVDPKGHPSSGRRISEALPRFREATLQMAAATDALEIKSLEFCTEIEAYGQIKPFAGNRFVAGQQVILYCEVENFVANPNGAMFETHLQGTYDVFDGEGNKLISQLLPADRQVSRNHLRDYFVAYQMHLPKQLKPGTYRLQLTMEDVHGKKYGQASIPMEIAE
ncbi:hypothetical protein [Stieleria varia]|nr:hypothetical protein [Stieleria varia]